MKIRQGDRWDMPDICELLRHYRSATPWKRMAEVDDEQWVTKLLSNILAGAGVIFVAEEQGQIVGMLLAIKNTNIWDPKIYMLQELAYWVEPEYRGGTAGYKLIKSYIDHCNELKQSGAIAGYTISKMVNSPDLDYGRFGFEKLEEQWRA